MTYDFSDISVLVVDDDRPMKTLIASVINALKVKECFTAQDGQQALEVFNSCKPDIIITDLEMPVTNGIELIANVRKVERKTGEITPIILMSGNVDAVSIKQAINAGVTEYLAKPFALNDLAKRLDYVLSKPMKPISSQEYFGPDRRRRKLPSYQGPYRRMEDKNG